MRDSAVVVQIGQRRKIAREHVEVGHVDDILRRAIAAGLDPIRAIRMATWNAATCWGLEETGAVAPGYLANLVILDDLESVSVRTTLYRGRVVAENGTWFNKKEREEEQRRAHP